MTKEENTSVKTIFFILLQYLSPQHLLSHIAGRLAETQLAPVKNLLISIFMRFYKVNLEEAERVSAKDYKSFNDFFCRALKDEARPVDSHQRSVVSPADSLVSQAGPIEEMKIIQAKGKDYSVLSLLANRKDLEVKFADGCFATLYLAPHDYHRVHMPCRGTLKEMIYVPGDLFSVNTNTAKHVSNLFARNERVIAIFEGDFGPFAMVLVGAMIVGSIETVWAGQVCPPSRGVQEWRYSEELLEFAKGEEMGRFKLGSTVIMLFPEGVVKLLDEIKDGKLVKVGELLGHHH